MSKLIDFDEYFNDYLTEWMEKNLQRLKAKKRSRSGSKNKQTGGRPTQ